MAEFPPWLCVEVGDHLIGDQVPVRIRMRAYLKVGPIEAEIGIVDGNDPAAVETLLREVADEMRRVRLASWRCHG